MLLAITGFSMTLLWLLAAAGIFMFARWLRGFLGRFDFSQETKLLIMIAFVGVMIFGTANFLWKLADKSGQPQPANTQETVTIEATDLDAFVASNYPTLHDYRSSLKRRIAELRSFFGDIRQWAKSSPRQFTFLKSILDIRWESYEALRAADREVDLSLREFWIYYQTGQEKYIARVFEDEAADLVEKIKDAQAYDKTADDSEREETDALLSEARKQLENEDIPRDPKNRKKELEFKPYDDKNRQMLLDWLQTKQNEGTLISSLEILADNQNEIEKNLKIFSDYLKDEANRDLYEPLQKIIKQWQDLGRYNLYAQYQILYAVEAEYFIEKLTGQTPPDAPPAQQTKASQQLYVRLREVAPVIARRAKSRRVDGVEQSYSPSSFAIKNQKKL